MSVSYRVQSVQYQRQREKTEKPRRRCLQTRQVPTYTVLPKPRFSFFFTNFAQALLKVDDANKKKVINGGGESCRCNIYCYMFSSLKKKYILSVTSNFMFCLIM